MFTGNEAVGMGGAIFVLEHLMDEFIHVNNPDCFLAYHNPLLPPSEWKVCIERISGRWYSAKLHVFSNPQISFESDLIEKKARTEITFQIQENIYPSTNKGSLRGS